MNGKKGLLGITGEILLPIEFQEIENCYEGYIVDKDYFRGCYNEKIELILPFIYKIPQINCYWPIVRKAEKLGMLNIRLMGKNRWDSAGIKELKEIIPCIYDDVYNEQGVSLKRSEENHTFTWFCKMPYFSTNLQDGTKRFFRYELKEELNVYVSAVIVETFDCDNFTSYSIIIGNKEYLGRKKKGKGFDKIEIGSVNIYQEQISYFTFIDEGNLTIITTPDNMFLNKSILFSNIKCDNFRCLWCCNGEGFDYVLALQVNNAQNIDLFINYNGLSMCIGSFDSIIGLSYELIEDKNELLEGQLDDFFRVKKSGRQQYLSLFGESIESIVDLNSYETKIQEEPFYFDACYFLFFDVETTGLFVQNGLKTDPRLVQLSWILTTKSGTIIKSHSYIVKPNKFLIPESSSDIHGITTSVAEEKGLVLNDVLMAFCRDMKRTKYYVGHNIDFDEKVILDEMERASIQNPFKGKEKICTMKSSANYCQIKNFRGIKYPKLEELYSKLFGHSFPNAHNATSDVLATMKCFFALQQKGVISLPDDNETCDDLPF